MQTEKVLAIDLKPRQNVNFFGEWYIVSAVLPTDRPSVLKLCLTHPAGMVWSTLLKNNHPVTTIVTHPKVEE